MTSYTAQIRQWSDKQKRNHRNILRTATQETVADMQTPVAQGGNMPVLDGFLRNSLASGLNGQIGPPSEDSYILTVANFDAGDTASFVYTAAYARARHYKPESFGQGGGMFRDKAAAQWQQRVADAAKRFK